MCGISGMIGLPTREETIEKMLATMHRRGPDAAAFYQDTDAALLHSRLAIIDLEKGKQPMELSWAGNTTFSYITESFITQRNCAGH